MTNSFEEALSGGRDVAGELEITIQDFLVHNVDVLRVKRRLRSSILDWLKKMKFGDLRVPLQDQLTSRIQVCLSSTNLRRSYGLDPLALQGL